VLSHARSGSTLLRYILDTHPEVACPSELNLGSLCGALYRVLDLTVGQHVGYPKDNVADSRVCRGMEAILRSIISDHLSRTGKKIWCEKSADDVFHLDLLLQILPEAKFICLYRNGLDVIHSVVEAFRWGFDEKRNQYLLRSLDNPILAVASFWIDVTRTILAFEDAHRHQCFRLLYEELVLDHPRVLPALFDFIGIEWSADLLSRVFTTKHEPGPGDQKLRFATRIYEDLIGKGSKTPVDMFHEKRVEIDQIHARLGYPSLAQPWPDAIRNRFRMTSSAVPVCRALTVSEVFTDFIPNRLKSLPYPRNTVVGLIITGPDGGDWTIDFGRGTTELRRQPDPWHCSITLQSADLLAIVSERLSIAEAYMQGRMKYEGQDDTVRDAAMLLFGPISTSANG
jgi:hypothetical protein